MNKDSKNWLIGLKNYLKVKYSVDLLRMWLKEASTQVKRQSVNCLIFYRIQPSAAVEMSDKVQTLSNVKEVFLYDKTTIQRKKITQDGGEVKPQEM